MPVNISKEDPVKKKKRNLTEGPVIPVIIRMTGGMLFGVVAVSVFNIVDTYFVGRLGASHLAAMSFTFPVIMFLNSISLGLGVGVSSVVSRAIGAGDQHTMKRTVTDGLILAVVIVAFVSIIGIVTIRPLFTALGAAGETLELVHDYMLIWYIGIPCVVIPMVGNNAIRATGDTLTPSLIMIVAIVTNIVLDPLLIFGVGPFPEMGIAGAALATVIGHCAALLFSLGILFFRENMVTFERPGWNDVVSSWKSIGFVGIPAGLVQAINPLSLGIITRLLSRFGEKVVAGFGAASRVEMFVMIIPMALAAVMAPFSGQNWGAKKTDRIKKGFRFAGLVSLAWGTLAFIVFIFLARPILSFFNGNPEIVQAGSTYLRIASFSYGFLGVLVIASQSFSALNKPLRSAGLNILKAFVLNIPLALLGGYFIGERGIFTATLLTNIIGGVLAFIFITGFLNKSAEKIGDPVP